MKVFDYICSVKSVLKTLEKLNLRPEDAGYIAMFEEYKEMKVRGDKITYIAESLSAKYGIKPRKFYYIIKKFNSPL